MAKNLLEPGFDAASLKFGDDETMNEHLTSIDIYSLEHGILLKQMASSGK
jgi:hypothetical protein